MGPWILVALVVGAAALVARRRVQVAPELVPQLLAFKPAISVGSRFSTYADQYAQVSTPPRIPAAALAAAATKAVYAGAYDNLLPDLRELANNPAEAERARGTIVGALWQGINVGIDGAPVGRSTWDQQHLRFNVIAIAIQDALSESRPLPLSLLESPLLRPLTEYAYLSVEELSPPAQWLCHRYAKMVWFDCRDWDDVWVQGHSAQQIYGKAPAAVGGNPDECQQVRASRIRFMYERLGRLLSDPSYTEVQFVDELAAEALRVGKRKIVIWPGGPAVSPYVDWGWVVGALVRMYAAAARGDVDELAAIGEEAGAKAMEDAQRSGEDYGAAELATQLQDYAGELASRS